MSPVVPDDTIQVGVRVYSLKCIEWVPGRVTHIKDNEVEVDWNWIFRKHPISDLVRVDKWKFNYQTRTWIRLVDPVKESP